MADCTVCEDFDLLTNATCSEKAFRWNVLKTLCAITELLVEEDTEVAPETVILPQVQIEAATIESGYASFASVPSFIDTTKQLKNIRVVNASDAELQFSFDSGTKVAFSVLAYSEYKADLNLTLGSLTSFMMRKFSGQTAGTGKVIIEGSY